MKLNGNFLFMGVEKQESRPNDKGQKEIFYKVGLMQGLQSKTFYVDEIGYKKYETIPVASPVYADIEINDRDGKTYYQLHELKVVSTQQRNEGKAS